MAKAKVKPYNGGTWTQARFNSFIKGLLRMGTMKWGPINEARKLARVDRGLYLCAECGGVVPATLPNPKGKGRINNIFVDHIDPIIDPEEGFVSWDDTIRKMFCELDNLQILCRDCHDKKSKEEKQLAKQRRANESSTV